MEALARRAGLELAAAGERPRKRSVQAAEALTAPEAQVAKLASTGLGNSEIGSQLFISPSTVEYHLRKIYRNPGISSRVWLPAAIRNAILAAGHEIGSAIFWAGGRAR
jgi:DNA-binding CsgD family transcriptional regulator